jgi:trimeric autotransporter adhesin
LIRACDKGVFNMTHMKYLICAFMLISSSLLAATVEAQTSSTVIPDSVNRIVIAGPPQGTTMPLNFDGSTDKALVTVTNTGAATGGGVGVSGNAPVGYGVQGTGLIGVNGMGGANGTGISGNSSGNGTGVVGQSNSGIGVSGSSVTDRGVSGSGPQSGVYGIGTGLAASNGVYGTSVSGTGVFGTSTNGSGVIGISESPQRERVAAVYGENRGGGYAGYFSGKVLVLGTMIVTNGCTGCSPPSDRNLKSNFSLVNPRFILDRLVSLPIQAWNYKGESRDIRHIGPVAQDFRAAFGLGEGDKTLNTVDAQGVALAAIQGLYRMIQEKDKKIEQLENRLSRLERSARRSARRRTQR